MSKITFKDIYIDGNKITEDTRKVIYLLPSQPLKYASNTWIYKTMPTMNQWLKDIEVQKKMHLNQSSYHLSFSFPANEKIDEVLLEKIRELGFQIGVLELYVIEAKALKELSRKRDVDIQLVSSNNINDYLHVYDAFARPFGDSYANMVKQHIYSSYNLDDIERLVAYVNHRPVRLVDIIMTDKTIEIDGFGVLEEFQHQGIGSEIQAYVGHMANERPVILVADGKDTAKDMYLRQGYVYQGFKYHILKENI